MDVYDPTDKKIFTTYSQSANSTVVMTYKVPKNASGGEYTIKVYNY